MFTKVHHVTYVVQNVQQMAEYLERSFGLKPERTDEIPDGATSPFCTVSGPSLWTSSSLPQTILRWPAS